MNSSSTRIAELRTALRRAFAVVGVLDADLRASALDAQSVVFPSSGISEKQRAELEAALPGLEPGLEELHRLRDRSTAEAQDWREKSVLARNAGRADSAAEAQNRAQLADRAAAEYEHEASEARTVRDLVRTATRSE